MGLFDGLLGRGGVDGQPAKRVEDILALEAFVGKLSGALGEEFSKTTLAGRGGFTSKTQVIAIVPPETLLFKRPVLEEVSISEMKREAGNATAPGGTTVNQRIFDDTIRLLENDGVPYRILVSKKGPAPLLIETSKANVYIAPIIQSV